MSTLTSATSAFVTDLTRTARGSTVGTLGSIMEIGHTTGPLPQASSPAASGIPSHSFA